MTETLLAPPTTPDLAPDTLLQPEQLTGFNTALNEQAIILPEVADNLEAIFNSGVELIDQFGITPELFSDPAHALVFTSIANRYAQLEVEKPEMSSSEYATHKEFIADATVMLAGDKSTHFEEFKELLTTDEVTDPEKEASIYDRYTNVQVTQELKQAIRDGLLDAVKSRLGITTENEDAYDVRVMNVTDDNTTHGMRVGISDELRDKHYKDPAWEEFQRDSKSFVDYDKDLKKKTAEFQKDLGRADKIPVAWVNNASDGKRTLCMPLPFVEKILYQDQERAKYYDESSFNRDFAIFEHEYTHTQGGLNLDASISFGMSLEERRAEFFSGDKNGYQDIKGSLMDISAISGIKFIDDMENKIKGGSAAELYTNIAEQIGLDSMLELIIVPPKAYISESRPLQAEAANYLGGLDGVTERIYNRLIAQGKQGEINARLDKWATKWSQANPETLNMVIGMRRGLYKLQFVTDMVEQRVKAIREAEQVQEVTSINAGK